MPRLENPARRLESYPRRLLPVAHRYEVAKHDLQIISKAASGRGDSTRLPYLLAHMLFAVFMRLSKQEIWQFLFVKNSSFAIAFIGRKSPVPDPIGRFVHGTTQLPPSLDTRGFAHVEFSQAPHVRGLASSATISPMMLTWTRPPSGPSDRASDFATSPGRRPCCNSSENITHAS